MTKKVHPREFQVEDLVSKKILSVALKDRSKANGYLIMKKIFLGALILSNIDGKDLLKHVYLDAIKKYSA